MKRGVVVGIAGAGRMGEAIARRLPRDTKLILSDRIKKKAEKVAGEVKAKAETNEKLFSRSDIILLLVPPSKVIPLVKRSGGFIKKGALLVNMATGISTAGVRRATGRRDIKVIGAKPVGQWRALSKGEDAVFILSGATPSASGPLMRLLKSMGKVVSGDDALAGRINKLATRYGLRAAAGLRKHLKKMGATKDVIDAALKNVVAGTIQDYPPKGKNEYISSILKKAVQ